MNYLNNKSSSSKQKPLQTIVSPSLFVYKPTIESLYSILIRIFGCYLFILLFFLIISFGDSFLFGEFFFSFKSLFGGVLYLFKPIFFVFSLFYKKFVFGLFLFLSFLCLLNHSHLGYRHSLVRGKFKGDFAYPFQRMAYTKFKFLEEDISHNYYQNPYTGELGYSYETEKKIADAIRERIREEDFYFFDDYKPVKNWVDPKGRIFLADGRKKEETFAKLGNWKRSFVTLKKRANFLIWFKFIFGVFFSLFSLYLICYSFYINLLF